MNDQSIYSRVKTETNNTLVYVYEAGEYNNELASCYVTREQAQKMVNDNIGYYWHGDHIEAAK